MTAGFAHNLFHIPELAAVKDAAAAIIVDEEGRYLMQLRDDKAGIFYPDHWGLFGGAIEPGEDGETALRRELVEELGWPAGELTPFTTMDFGFDALGAGRAIRFYYEVRMPASDVPGLVLGEGQSLEVMAAPEILLNKRVVPYDSFAVWLHYARRAKTNGRTN
jgi:8-oxo-dGTP pyrophosphatase MutT (NUDIX family)